MSDNIPSRHSKKKKSGNNYLTWIFLIAAFLIAACAGAYYASSSSLFDKPEEKKVTDEKRMVATDKTTVMIMGVDQREDDIGRSDTLMVATLDPKKDKAALLSVPRDTRVKIKKHGYDKINAAFAYGGYKLSQDTVENLLGVNIDHYVIVDVHAFQRIIDAIGGVDIDVEKRMYYEDPWDDDGGLLIDLQPGMQHMDGKTAITYVRYRDEEGDIGRIKRQQNFMKAVLDKVTSPSIITSLPTVIKEVFNSVKTDLSLKQMLEFATSLKDAQKNGLTAEMVPGKPMYISGVSYWIPDLKKLRYTVAETLDVTLSVSDKDALEQESLEYSREIPSSATNITLSDYNKYSRESDERSDSRKSTDSDRDKRHSNDREQNDSNSDIIDNRRSEKSNNSSNDSDESTSSDRDTAPEVFRNSNVKDTPSEAAAPSGEYSTPSPNVSTGGKTR